MPAHRTHILRKNSRKNSILSAIVFLQGHIFLAGVVILLLLNMFQRFYQLEDRIQFSFDQVENSWTMKNMRINGQLPLLGMQAKGNSGFYIGPLYYYMLYPFYVATDLDPIAGGYFVGIVSVITLLAILFVVRQLFNETTSLITGFIYTISNHVIHFDHIAWPVVFLPLISVLTYYFLLRVIEGKTKYFIPLAIVIGFAFHVHFTAIFLPIIVCCCVPFFRFSRQTILHMAIAFLCFAMFWIPMVVANSQARGMYGSNLVSYLDTYFHGFHLRRVIQLIPDAFMEFSSLIGNRTHVLDFLRYLWIPVFALVLFLSRQEQKKRILAVTVLFFIVPLLVLSTYRGELTDYYYSLGRPIVAIVIGYILATLLSHRLYVLKGIAIVCLSIYAVNNLQLFGYTEASSLAKYKKRAIAAVEARSHVEFSMGDQVSYLFDFFLYRKTGIWPTSNETNY